MGKKKISKTVLGIVFLLFAGVAGTWILKSAQAEQREREEIAQVFQPYQSYGYYEDVQHYGRKKITTYYCYGLAFDASRIWVVPLQFEKELILPGEPVLITADALGAADISIANDKEGKPRRVSLHLYDKSGTSFLNCKVEVQNTREDSYHHVNILQEEECARFGRLMDSIADQVNRDNPGLKEQVHTTEAYTRKAYVRGIFGVVFGVFFPPVGFFFSITGLRLAKEARIGNELTVQLVICRGGLVISSIFLLLEGGALLYAFLR